MTIARITGLLFGLLLSPIALLYAYIGIGTSLFEPGVRFRALGVVIAALPLMVAFWIVYHSLCTDDVKARLVLGWPVYPSALLRAVVAELCLVLAIVLVVMFT